jgi:pectin methylesterase-like acyl-CoA thioesterase
MPSVPSRRAAFAVTARSLTVSGLAVATMAVGLPAALAADDTTAPAAVRGMSVSADTSRVKLDWSSNKESDLAGYDVYRSIAADGVFDLLTTAPRTASDFSDTAAPVGVPAYYQVIAVDKSGNKSAPVATTGTRKDKVKPAAPTTASVTGSGTTFTIDWADNGEADLAGYVVSRATSAGGSYTKLTATPVTASTFTDTGVPAGKTPYYKITAVDLSGNSSSSISVTLPDTAAPAAVRSMSVTVSTSSVKLDWSSNSESDLAGYHVYRGASADGEFAKLTTTPRTSSDYTDSTAPIGVPAYYRVTAVDKSGNESVVVATSGTRKDATAPAVPTGATVSGSGTTFTLDWADNADADIAGYVVSRATSASGSYTKLTATPVTASTFTDTGVPAGKTPYYKITAVDLSGNSSAATTVTVPDTAAPAAVRSVTVTTSTSSVKLDWSNNSESDLAGYNVYRAAADGEFAKLTATPRTSSDYTDSTAPVGVPASYRITAVDKSGNESVLVATTGTRKDGVAPTAPTGLTAAQSTQGFTLEWKDNTEADLAGYQVSRATSSGGTYTVLATQSATEPTFTDASAPAGKTVYYKVTAVDASGNVSAAAAVTAVPVDTTAPAAIAPITVSADTSRVKLDWASSKESDLAGYLVYRANSADGEYIRLMATPVTSSEYSDTTSIPGTPMHYRVVAVDKSGNESLPVAATGTRKDAIAPVTPAGLTAVARAEGITLDWADNTEADLAGYVVSRSTSKSGTYTTLTTTPVTASTFLDATAPAGITSYYKVTAVDVSGNGSAAVAIDAVMVDAVAPAAPTGLTATGTPTGIQLTWAKNTENDVAGYLVSRSDSADVTSGLLTQTPITAATYLDATAPADHHSFYQLIAVDKSGNKSVAATVEAVPADTIAPASPGSLVATGSDDGVTLDWTAVTDADLAGYVVARSDKTDGTFTVLTKTPITEPSYTDAAAPTGVTSYYKVTAADAAGNASTAATANAMHTVAKAPVAGADVTVAQDGSGDYTTVAAALAAAPASASTPFAIGIRPGTYRETLTVARANVTLFGSGTNAGDVVITYDNASGTKKADGTTYGTSGSATVLIKGNNVTTKNLTIENSYKETGTGSEQAVALKTTGDRLVFDNVRLIADQDTLYADSPAAGTVARSYYTNSYIEGDVDFVFGRGTAVFDHSTLKAATRGSTTNNGYVTAASTDKSVTYGFLITDSTITSDAPTGSFNLGRPWQPSNDANAIAQVVIRNTELPAAIKSSAWTDMSTTFSWRNARFAEYQNTGAGAVVNADRPQLSDADAGKYTKFTYLAGSDDWNPTGEIAPVPVDAVAPSAPSGLAATAGDNRVDLTWTANTEADVAGYNLYRSTDADVALTAANKVNTDLLPGKTYADKPDNGSTYTYVLTAVDKAGNESPVSAEVTASPASVPLPEHDILVAADGSGDYTTVQAALTAAPAGTAAKPTVIAVKPGTYKELLSVSKNYVTVIGTTGNPRDVVFSYDNAAGTPLPSGTGTYGTGGSQSVLVSGNNVTVKGVTIENTFDEAAYTYSAEQAVALKTTGDRLVFDNVRVLGNQDTLLVDSPDAPVVARSYFVNSYIEGDVDFIFGRGTAVFDKSTINALSRGSSSNNGYLTAASTSDKNSNGFLITDSKVTSNAPAGTFSLGRPWRGWTDGYTKNGVVYNSRGQVTIRNTELPAAIRTTQPWADMSPNLWTDGRFSEYNNTGAGAVGSANRPQLTDAQAATSTKWSYLAGSDGWNPTGATAPKVVDTTAPAAPTALTATAGDSRATLSWTAPADKDVANYNVYRSATGPATAASTKVTGSTVSGTSYTDAGLVNGTSYSYVVTAVDTAGNESAVSAAVTAAPVAGDTAAPAVPAGVATKLGKSKVTVSWTSVADADLAGYAVYRSIGSGASTKLATVSGTSFTDSTATVGTSYRYTVTATDTSGNESAASGAVSATPVKADVIVAADGSGDATTIQAGINLLADNADYTTQGGRIILVQPGTYTGVVASGNRYGVTLIGATSDAKDTVITAGGTGSVATVTLSGKGWSLKNLTVASTNGATTAGAVATALSTQSDKAVFSNVRFLGDKTTLAISSPNTTTAARAYFVDAYIEGGADMVLGRGTAVFDRSTFHVLNRSGASLTDSSVDKAFQYGFLITNSKIVTDGPAASVYLGRPYGTTGWAQVVVRNTDLGAGVNTAQPWKDWDATTTWTAGRFWEYQNTGAGAAGAGSLNRPELAGADAATYTAKTYLAGSDGWNPTGQ